MGWAFGEWALSWRTMPPFCPIHDFRNRWGQIPKMRPSSAEPPDAIHRVDNDSFLREPNKVRRDPREQATRVPINGVFDGNWLSLLQSLRVESQGRKHQWTT
jgi:hypothetical protein